MPTPYRKMTPEQKKKAHEIKKRWALKNRDKIVAYKRKHYRENRDKYLAIERARAYKKLYGIGVEDYDRMFLEQSGLCGICKSNKSVKGDKIELFCVDHCHKTGKVRGLLCIGCNSLLGRYELHKDSIINYLNKI